MPPNEFQKFTHEGYFTVHQTKKYWSGRFSDQVIECALMCPLKPVGGIIQRGIASNTTTRFTLGKVNLLDICQEVENFCAVSTATTEQHVDVRPSHIVRDNADVNSIDNWFQNHYPFPEIPHLICISTRVSGNETNNCHQAFEVGYELMKNMTGQRFGSVKFQRKNKLSTRRQFQHRASLKFFGCHRSIINFSTNVHCKTN